MFVTFLGHFEKHHFLSKNCCGNFLGNLKNWATIPTSVRTAYILPTYWGAHILLPIYGGEVST